MATEKKASVTVHRGDSGLVAQEAIYATADGRLVGEDDPAANVLVASAGSTISEKMVERFNIKASDKAAPDPRGRAVNNNDEVEKAAEAISKKKA